MEDKYDMKTLRKIIALNKSKSLSNNDIIKQLGGKVKVYSYDELSQFPTIDALLEPYESVVILYETAPDFGHWCCLFKAKNDKGKDIISFFDPYALKVDDQLNFINKDFRLKNNSYYPTLSALMTDSNYPIEYNEHPVQQMKDGTNTCGRWCIMRLKLKHLPLKEFYDLFKSDKNFSSDDLVILATI